MKIEQNKKGSIEPIAIVAMSCRFPSAGTLQEFWNLLSQAKETITEMPSNRWNAADYYDPDLEAHNKTNQHHASFLENIHDFDPLFFNISPAEATEMNPSQKLLLELVWETIEDSSIHYDDIRGHKIGVYVGNIWNDFEHLRKHKNANVTSHSAIGQSSNIIANRVSFNYGFTGPSLVVDTGCSSSLVALHLACQSLWDNSTEMSFVAGINHILDPDQYVLLSKFGGLSSKGRCSTFDINGDGFVRGEGAGVLLLKRLSEAEKDGNKICAIIRGTAINNNGYNVNLPATSVAGQKQVLEEAYAISGIHPSEVHYVEAHGTGTKLGDPTESRALGEFFREERNENLRVGSVKTNIGHTEAAAGIAGLIKVVLAIRHKQLPPSLHFKTPNPNIPFEELKLHVQNELGPWPVKNGETLKAGINSFGWGGTNAHAVIEEYRRSGQEKTGYLPAVNRYCLPLSAKSSAALKDYAKAYVQIFRQANDDLFHKICAATAILKPDFDHRVFFSARDKNEMITMLESFATESNDETVAGKEFIPQQKIVMVFPGQGSQWLSMGCELFDQEPVFRKAIEDCDETFKKHTNWSVKDELFATAEKSRLNEINVIQPVLCAVQISLARLWMSWGVKPDAVVGHSMGEVAAAHISGALSLDDAGRIICTRSLLMKKLSGKGGAMAVTELSLLQAEELLKRYPQLSVAVSNSPKSTVLAGDQHAITEVVTELETKGLFARHVKVDVASHSQQMDLLKDDLRNALQSITPLSSNNGVALYSTVRVKEMNGQELDSAYWVDNLRQTVQFASVAEKLMQSHTVFIEVSPHPVLINAINECADYLKKSVITIASIIREMPEQECIYKNLGELYVRGHKINWKDFYRTNHAPDVTLPSYPFQRERYELEDKSSELTTKRNDSKFPLLGSPILLAGDETTYFWETQLSLGLFPYINDHQVNESPVLPGAAYIEMMFEVASELYDKGIPTITRLRFIKSITLSKDEVSVIQVKLTQKGAINIVQFFVKVPQASGKFTWEILAEGELRIKSKVSYPFFENRNDRILSSTTGTSYYDSLKLLGLQYGSYFQGLRELKKIAHPFDEEVHFTLAIDQRIVSTSSKYKIHPALLDACFQPLFYSVLENGVIPNSRITFLTEADEIEWLEEVDYTQTLFGIAKLYPCKKNDQRGFINIEADITIYNDRTAVIKVSRLRGMIIDATLIEQRKEKTKNWLYKVSWVKREMRDPVTTKASNATWIIIGDPYGVSEILAKQMHNCNLSCIHVTPGVGFSKLSATQYNINYGSEQDYAKLLAELFINSEKKIVGIVHIGSMSYTWQDPYLTADIVEEHQVYGSISFMYLHQQLTALQLKNVPQLVIVTNGIQTASHEKDIPQPVHSPLWGMAKVMFNELTHYNCRCFDLSANPSIEELDQIVYQLQLSKTSENEIAFRGTQQYVPRLGLYEDTHTHTHTHEPKEFSSDGTYLVTGFRGLGFVFIEWMIRQGARTFALISRSGDAPAEVLERIEILESQGCRFKIFGADAGVYHEIKEVVDEIELTMPRLKGVVHAAGLIEAKTLTELNQAELLRILNPKVKGAWNLHLLTQHNKEMDCFIMFSSASALIGLSGQGSYVGANAFLDTLAFTRKRMGLPGMSINWGVMKDVGMVANKAELEKYARAEGFEPVNMRDAMDVFHTIYDSEHTQIGIVKLHAETMASYYSTLSQTPYFMGLLTKENKTQRKDVSFLDKLVAAPTREDKITILIELVTQLVAKIVKTSAARINPTMTFKSLGIDSLMAVQLRNLLEKNANLKLSVSMFWTHPSIKEYATFLVNVLSEQLLIKSLEEHSSTIETTELNHWFVIPKPNPDAACRLFCFHDAGGNASLYDTWPEMLGDQIELIAIELPGRGSRADEKPYSEFKQFMLDLNSAILPLLNKPFSFFGHSMGGLTVFELTRELRKSKLPQPSKLFISSTPELTTYTRHEVDHTRGDEEMIKMYPHLNKLNIADDELSRVLMDLLRADLRLLTSYNYTKEPPLTIPLIVLHGIDDDRVKSEQAVKWKGETSSSCKVIQRPGGHSYIKHDNEFLTKLITNELSLVTIQQESIEN